MKLKEKLAEEYATKLYPKEKNDFPIDWRDAAGIWQAGFEKARAMAAEMVEPYDCDIQEEMKDMGEEEVK